MVMSREKKIRHRLQNHSIEICLSFSYYRTPHLLEREFIGLPGCTKYTTRIQIVRVIPV